MKLRYYIRSVIASSIIVVVGITIFLCGYFFFVGGDISESFDSLYLCVLPFLYVVVYPLACLRNRSFGGLDIQSDRERIIQVFDKYNYVLELEEFMSDGSTRLCFRTSSRWSRLGGFDKVYLCRKQGANSVTLAYGYPMMIGVLLLYIGRQNWSK